MRYVYVIQTFDTEPNPEYHLACYVRLRFLFFHYLKFIGMMNNFANISDYNYFKTSDYTEINEFKNWCEKINR